MGERGPVPKEVRRRRNKRPPGGTRIAVGRPRMPRALTGEARAEWNRIVPEIEAMGLLATLDRGALIRYCRAWADWWQVDAQIQATGLLIKGRRDGLVRSPLFLLRIDLEATLSDLGKQLGLSPAARLRQGVRHDVSQPEDDARPRAISEYKKALGIA